MSLLAPETIDLAALPSVSLVEWKQLPREAGLYFVLRVETGEVMYIGQSRNCRVRWYAHVPLRNAVEQFACRIAWLRLPLHQLNQAEIEAIAYWKPRLNLGPGGRVPLKPPKYASSIRLTPEARTLLQRLSDALGVSQAAVLETIIRERAKRERLDAAARPRRTPVGA